MKLPKIDINGTQFRALLARIFDALSRIELALCALALPMLLASERGLPQLGKLALLGLVVIAALVFTQGLLYALADFVRRRENSKIAQEVVSKGAGNGQMQGKPGYRNFGPKPKLSNRQMRKLLARTS
ncbi:MAG: hypothetical protein JST92_12865 [Deltaproteobacteria bacterium]|nr:hypothetical protein [Deltaproteobacteria bacterium]